MFCPIDVYIHFKTKKKIHELFHVYNLFDCLMFMFRGDELLLKYPKHINTINSIRNGNLDLRENFITKTSLNYH